MLACHGSDRSERAFRDGFGRLQERAHIAVGVKRGEGPRGLMEGAYEFLELRQGEPLDHAGGPQPRRGAGQDLFRAMLQVTHARLGEARDDLAHCGALIRRERIHAWGKRHLPALEQARRACGDQLGEAVSSPQG